MCVVTAGAARGSSATQASHAAHGFDAVAEAKLVVMDTLSAIATVWPERLRDHIERGFLLETPV